MAKAMGPFRDSQAPSRLSGPQINVPDKPPSHMRWCQGLSKDAK